MWEAPVFMYRKPRAALLGAALALVAIVPAIASPFDPRDMQVGEIEISNDGTSNAIYVRWTFTPALPCPMEGFVYWAGDAHQKEITALLLTAKPTGRTASFVHVCSVGAGSASSGYSRATGTC